MIGVLHEVTHIPASTYERKRSGSFCFTNWLARFLISELEEFRRASPNTTSCTRVSRRILL